MGATSGRSFPYGPVVIGGGLAGMAVASVGYFRDLDPGATSAIFLLGALLLVIGAFYNRIEGSFRLGKDGLEMIVAAVGHAEKQLERGDVVDSGEISSRVRDIRDSLDKDLNPARPERVVEKVFERPVERVVERVVERPVDTSAVGPKPPASEQIADPEGAAQRQVVIVDDVVMDMAKLGDGELSLVESEIERLRNRSPKQQPDPRAIRAGDGGQSYRVRRVPETNLRIWYRPVDPEKPDDALAVALLQRT